MIISLQSIALRRRPRSVHLSLQSLSIGVALVLGVVVCSTTAQTSAVSSNGGARRVVSWEYATARGGGIDLEQQSLNEDWALAPPLATAFLHLRVPFSSQVTVTLPSGKAHALRSRSGYRNVRLTRLPSSESIATVAVRLGSDKCLESCSSDDERKSQSCTKQVTLFAGCRHYVTFTTDDFGTETTKSPGPVRFVVADSDGQSASEVLPTPSKMQSDTCELTVGTEEKPTSTQVDYQFAIKSPASVNLKLDQNNSKNVDAALNFIKPVLSSARLQVGLGTTEFPRIWPIDEKLRVHMRLHAYRNGDGQKPYLTLNPMPIVALKPDANASRAPTEMEIPLVPGDLDDHCRMLTGEPGKKFLSKLFQSMSEEGSGSLDLRVYVSRIHQVQDANGEGKDIVLQRHRIDKPLRLLTLTAE